MITERHVRHFLICGALCGVFAAMPALCAAQDTAASGAAAKTAEGVAEGVANAAPDKPASKPDGAQSGFNPFGALRDFFGRVLPAQQAAPEPAPVPVSGSSLPASPVTAPGATPAAASAPPAPASTGVPAMEAVAPPAPAIAAGTASPAQNGSRQGIALILPMDAAALTRAAEITRAGFMAARAAGKDPASIIVIHTDGSPERARAAYREAAAKALVVVGPLTRGEVSALLGETLPVPTLVLNLPETPAGTAGSAAGAKPLPAQMRALALSIEHEAASAARAVYRPEAGVAVVVTTGSALHRRAAGAFSAAWSGLGGTIADTVEFSGSLARVRQSIERTRAATVFLAADTDRARLLRPYLGRNTVVIATSQVYSGPPASDAKKFHDLNGIRFVDMPWLHQADRAAFGFASPEAPLTPDLERLYALGIDAYRVALEIMRGRAAFDLDGVTGRLRVGLGVIAREPMQAEYRDGEVSAIK